MGIFRVTDTRILYLGVDSSTNNGAIVNLDPRPSTPVLNWQNEIAIPGGVASVMNKGSIGISSDSSTLYIGLSIGDSTSTAPLVFLKISEQTGEISGTPYVSSEP